MSNKVSKVVVWAAEIEDQPGGVSDKLLALSQAGANIQFVLGRRQPDRPGKGVLFLSPVSGRKQEEAARLAGFSVTSDLIALRVEGPNKKGLGQKMAGSLASAGINIRAFVATVIGSKFAAYFAFDNPMDAERGMKELRRVK